LDGSAIGLPVTDECHRAGGDEIALCYRFPLQRSRISAGP
jgi:hypothetical protein